MDKAKFQIEFTSGETSKIYSGGFNSKNVYI